MSGSPGKTREHERHYGVSVRELSSLATDSLHLELDEGGRRAARRRSEPSRFTAGPAGGRGTTKTIQKVNNKPQRPKPGARSGKKLSPAPPVAVPAPGIPLVSDKWVQCERCGKWRLLGPHANLDLLPDKWVCSMNTDDVARASCDVPEQVVPEPVVVPVSAVSAEIPGSAYVNSLPLSQESLAGSYGSPRNQERHGKKRSRTSNGGVDTTYRPSSKRARRDGPSPGNVNYRASLASVGGSGTPQLSAVAHEATAQPTALPAAAPIPTGPEWVQCERCGKWRSIPRSANVDTQKLPEEWFCEMNYWTPSFASCDAPEEEYTWPDGSARSGTQPGPHAIPPPGQGVPRWILSQVVMGASPPAMQSMAAAASSGAGNASPTEAEPEPTHNPHYYRAVLAGRAPPVDQKSLGQRSHSSFIELIFGPGGGSRPRTGAAFQPGRGSMARASHRRFVHSSVYSPHPRDLLAWGDDGLLYPATANAGGSPPPAWCSDPLTPSQQRKLPWASPFVGIGASNTSGGGGGGGGSSGGGGSDAGRGGPAASPRPSPPPPSTPSASATPGANAAAGWSSGTMGASSAMMDERRPDRAVEASARSRLEGARARRLGVGAHWELGVERAVHQRSFTTLSQLASPASVLALLRLESGSRTAADLAWTLLRREQEKGGGDSLRLVRGMEKLVQGELVTGLGRAIQQTLRELQHRGCVVEEEPLIPDGGRVTGGIRARFYVPRFAPVPEQREVHAATATVPSRVAKPWRRHRLLVDCLLHTSREAGGSLGN